LWDPDGCFHDFLSSIPSTPGRSRQSTPHSRFPRRSVPAWRFHFFSHSSLLTYVQERPSVAWAAYLLNRLLLGSLSASVPAHLESTRRVLSSLFRMHAIPRTIPWWQLYSVRLWIYSATPVYTSPYLSPFLCVSCLGRRADRSPRVARHMLYGRTRRGSMSSSRAWL